MIYLTPYLFFVCITMIVLIIAPFVPVLRMPVYTFFKKKFDVEAFEAYVKAMEMIIKDKIKTSDDAMSFSAAYIFSIFICGMIAPIILAFWPLILLWLIGTGVSYYFLRTKSTDTDDVS